MTAVRTHIAVCHQAADAVTAEPTKSDEPTVEESSDIQVMVLSKVVLCSCNSVLIVSGM
jgi:hypothetical protein